MSPATDYPVMVDPGEVSSIESLRTADPEVYDALQTVMAYLRNELLPEQAQLELIEAMTPAVRRQLVAQFAGLDASVVMIFKEQVALISNVTRRIINPDGTLVADGERSLNISVKDAMNMSLKVVGMMTKDLPKVLTLGRVQRQEQALLQAAELLPPDLQDQFLVNLEKLEMEAAKNG